ncbi:hypothetical protein ACFPOE_12605 [Caenimonas terrae]|uniref:VanZ family protein n=1 Tax=Caenimonas terrae TaxID=696074 RepID=A0ABW0NH37_9BURK
MKSPWKILSALLIATVLVSKLMPNPWKMAVMDRWHGPIDMSLAAHLLMFALTAFSITHAVTTPRAWKILGSALALSVATEALQFFAIERHPSLQGVVTEMTGAFFGWGLAAVHLRLARRWRSGTANPAQK